jgi:phosphoribosylcarboxyaminoimidazole (NCAIR) mutase
MSALVGVIMGSKSDWSTLSHTPPICWKNSAFRMK